MKNGDSTVDPEVAARSSSYKGKGPMVVVQPHLHSSGAANKGLAVFDFVLRISAMVAALAAAAAMGTSDETLPFFTRFFQFQANYDDIQTFEFFMIAMSMVAGYLFLSLPLAIVCIVRPRAAGPRILLVILDTIMLTLATAAGAAATAIVYLAHNGNASTNWFAICQQFGDFCKKVSGAVVASLLAVVMMMMMVVLSGASLQRV